MSKMGSGVAGVAGVASRGLEGRTLRRLRVASGMYVYQMAEAAGLTAKQVHDLEDGKAFRGRAAALEACTALVTR